MKKLLKMTLWIVETCFALEIIAVPFGCWLNKIEPEAVYLKVYLCYNIMLIIATAVVGIILNEILKQKK